MIICASLLGRRFGPSFSGWLVGFPFTSAPVSVFLALEQGAAFAAAAAPGSIESCIADVAFTVVFAWTAGRGWPLATAAASIAFAAVGTLLALNITSTVVAMAIALPVLVLAPRLVPRRKPYAAGIVEVPRWDLPSRAIVATVLVLALTAFAPAIGPTPSGVLSGYPLYATVLAIFAYRSHGADAAREVMRGLLAGLFGFASFFVVIGLALVPLGAIAYALALTTVVGVQAATLVWLRRSGDRRGAAPVIG